MCVPRPVANIRQNENAASNLEVKILDISRRQFLAAASALLLATPAGAQSPRRLARKDSFLGLHFDFDPGAGDTPIGRDLTEAMVSHLLETCRPDFVQCDSKGQLGYLCFPSKTGMTVPGIVQDPLALWRRVTAAHGVALYNHFSGLEDVYAITKHPEWASVGANSAHDPPAD